jgi:hypothetical protein
MRQLSVACLLVAAMACGGSPTKPDPVQDQRGWSGTVTFFQTVAGGISATTAWTGTVVWNDSDLADLKTGATIFAVQSAKISAAYVGTAPCPANGSVSISEVTIDPAKDSKLTVQPDGSYTGSFHAVATIQVTTQNCPYPVVPPPTIDATFVGLDLIISGTANGLRLTGNMTPVVVETTTYKGSWDFGPVASSVRQP